MENLFFRICTMKLVHPNSFPISAKKVVKVVKAIRNLPLFDLNKPWAPEPEHVPILCWVRYMNSQGTKDNIYQEFVTTTCNNLFFRPQINPLLLLISVNKAATKSPSQMAKSWTIYPPLPKQLSLEIYPSIPPDSPLLIIN